MKLQTRKMLEKRGEAPVRYTCLECGRVITPVNRKAPSPHLCVKCRGALPTWLTE